MPKHRDRRATRHRAESAPPRSGRPKGDDGGATWSETALDAALPEAARAKPREICFQDETRVGQQGMLARVWAEKGSRPTAPRPSNSRSSSRSEPIRLEPGDYAVVMCPPNFPKPHRNPAAFARTCSLHWLRLLPAISAARAARACTDGSIRSMRLPE